LQAPENLKKIAVIGSGPIVIGQAAEFDYAGSQACRALYEERKEIVLINSNPATIMTDLNMADHTYMEPLTVDTVKRILEKERPQGLLPTLGGQVGLNLAKELANQGILEDLEIRLLGTSLETIEKAEDREKFKQCMEEIGEPVPPSAIVDNVHDAAVFAEQVGYPVIIRPAYTLGGTGGGMVRSREELDSTLIKGLKHSIINQALIEKSVAGWKEIEFEVIRDARDNCIIICSMENFDPAGIHTGDSIVVAPAQTLGPAEYNLLRDASYKIIRALGVEGGCNIQFALHPQSLEYAVIEVNPRVSRSSALASKATGYPIARVASKIAVGVELGDINNTVTGINNSCFEPVLDYCVVKVPRWPFDKFALAQRRLGTQMKATGEVMSLERNLEAALMKAARSLEIGVRGMYLPEIENVSDSEIRRRLVNPDDERLFVLTEALRRGFTPEEIHELTLIDPFFISKVNNIVLMEKELKSVLNNRSDDSIDDSLWWKAHRMGFNDEAICEVLGIEMEKLQSLKNGRKFIPSYKKVDTCAAEFESETAYHYSTFEEENETAGSNNRKMVILGSGPIRIGQGVEFDYCSVHAAWALQEEGVESIIINNNPETVSTDFDTSDQLFFEPLTAEDVMNVIEREKPDGAIVQFGGQTAINLAGALEENGVKVLGTSVENLDRTEDREKFDAILEKLDMKRPPGKACVSPAQAFKTASEVGYPVVVRPSYVLGGRAMEIVYREEELNEYMETAVKVTPNHPVFVDKYMGGLELEVDAVCDGKDVLVPGIMEHIERAGVHSGDSIAVYPPQRLAKEDYARLTETTRKLGAALQVRGIINIQYVMHEGELYVLEANPRSSRTVPFMSKVTGIPLINLATKISLGKNLAEMGYRGGIYDDPPYVSVKAPVFSFGKIMDLDTVLGPEMKSTGEVIGMGGDFATALYKALISAGFSLPLEGKILATISDKEKQDALEIIKGFADLEYKIMATEGTAAFLEKHGIPVERVRKVREGSPHIIDMLRNGEVNLVINTLTRGKAPERDGFRIRRAAADHSIYCLTSLDTAREIWQALKYVREGRDLQSVSVQNYLRRHSRLYQ